MYQTMSDRWLSIGSRLLLGTTIAFAGVEKLLRVRQPRSARHGQFLVDALQSNSTMVAVAVVEIVAAAFLASRWSRSAAAATLMLLCVFGGFWTAAMATGTAVSDCGCCGHLSLPPIARTAVLTGLAILAGVAVTTGTESATAR